MEGQQSLMGVKSHLESLRIVVGKEWYEEFTREVLEARKGKRVIREESCQKDGTN